MRHWNVHREKPSNVNARYIHFQFNLPFPLLASLIPYVFLMLWSFHLSQPPYLILFFAFICSSSFPLPFSLSPSPLTPPPPLPLPRSFAFPFFLPRLVIKMDFSSTRFCFFSLEIRHQNGYIRFMTLPWRLWTALGRGRWKRGWKRSKETKRGEKRRNEKKRKEKKDWQIILRKWKSNKDNI